MRRNKTPLKLIYCFHEFENKNFQIKDLDHSQSFGSLDSFIPQRHYFALELVDNYALLCLLDQYLDDDAIMISLY